MSSRSQMQEARHVPHVNPFKTDPEAFSLSDLYSVIWKPRQAFHLCKWTMLFPSWPKCATAQKQVWPDPEKREEKKHSYILIICDNRWNNNRKNMSTMNDSSIITIMNSLVIVFFVLIRRIMIVLLKSADISPHQQSVRKLWGLRLWPQKPAPFIPPDRTTLGRKCHCNLTTVTAVNCVVELNGNLVYLWKRKGMCAFHHFN